MRCRLLQDESIGIIIHAWTVEIPRPAEPLCRAGVLDKVVGGSRYRWRFHPDSHPERTIGCSRRSKDFTFIISNLPVAAIASKSQRRFKRHRQINSLPRSDLSWKRHKILPTDHVAADQHHTIGGFPRTSTIVLQTPNLCKRRPRSKHRIIGDG